MASQEVSSTPLVNETTETATTETLQLGTETTTQTSTLAPGRSH